MQSPSRLITIHDYQPDDQLSIEFTGHFGFSLPGRRPQLIFNTFII